MAPELLSSLCTPYEWCMAGWSSVQCRERGRVSDSSHRSKWALIKGATITLTSASSFQWVPPGVEEMALAGWKGLGAHVHVCVYVSVCVCVSETNPVTVTLKCSFSLLDLKVFSVYSKIDKLWTPNSMKKLSKAQTAAEGTLNAHACFLFDGGNVVW